MVEQALWARRPAIGHCVGQCFPAGPTDPRQYPAPNSDELEQTDEVPNWIFAPILGLEDRTRMETLGLAVRWELEHLSHRPQRLAIHQAPLPCWKPL